MRLKFIKPMEPDLVDAPPQGDEWIHEIKFDGYRTQVIKDDDGIRLITKNGYDWTGRYSQLAGEAAAIEARDFIIDGEAITVNEAGLSDFHALQTAVTSRKPSRDLYLVAFDLLHLNGHNLRDMPVEDRRDILQALIPDDGRIQFSEAMPGTGDAVYHLVDQAGLEGMVSKRKGSAYRSGPTMNWRKIKCFTERDLEIIGVKREAGKPAMALLAENGRYVGGAFITMNREIRERLWNRVQGKVGALAPIGLAKEKAEWLKPGLLGRVRFLKGEEKLRHASLKDFREDDHNSGKGD
ncbi:ATP-dependent DNA ligase [Mesorhizobium sp. B2-4-14]|uniref:ATP-dependent DNA ligase n=1 Tax=Mesorhizobium sp. B2-4-14 TaxID=2589935 RepID=UPI00112B9A76|nr:ATP-dependent DNA ligase [Mesorhizobium sp. B2-4-14]TPK93411.1 ATP-dependent DNA ligase [Mesorhizobium sp. B2-4-14]